MSTLRQSEEGADQSFGSNPAGGMMTPCASKDDWIEIQLLGEDGEPVPNTKYRVQLPDGRIEEGTLDAEGVAGFEGIAAGSCKITFPELDQEAWEPLGGAEETSDARPD